MSITLGIEPFQQHQQGPLVLQLHCPKHAPDPKTFGNGLTNLCHRDRGHTGPCPIIDIAIWGLGEEPERSHYGTALLRYDPVPPGIGRRVEILRAGQEVNNCGIVVYSCEAVTH